MRMDRICAEGGMMLHHSDVHRAPSALMYVKVPGLQYAES